MNDNTSVCMIIKVGIQKIQIFANLALWSHTLIELITFDLFVDIFDVLMTRRRHKGTN